MNFLTQKRSSTFLKKEVKPHQSESLASDTFYYKEMARLTGSGGWKVDFIQKSTFLDPAARKLLNVPQGYRASMNKLQDFYPEGATREKAIETFKACAQGIPYDMVSQMVSYDNRVFWVRAIGKPIFDPEGSIIGVQGVFQDISDQKHKEQKLNESLQTIASHNERLMNFAHMVTHNIHSQASNLQHTIELLSESASKEETAELHANLGHISESLNSTIDDLNKIVSIQSKSLTEKREVFFKDVLIKTKVLLNEVITEREVEIFSDFSEKTKISYNAEFLDSIFTTLISFMIQSNEGSKHLVIDVFTYKEADSYFLKIQDNGSGHACHGKSLFTVAKNPEEVNNRSRINLFVVKNQIETMNGAITVETAPGEGTTFKIRL